MQLTETKRELRRRGDRHAGENEASRGKLPPLCSRDAPPGAAMCPRPGFLVHRKDTMSKQNVIAIVLVFVATLYLWAWGQLQ
jgi:hypothetical protein